MTSSTTPDLSALVSFTVEPSGPMFEGHTEDGRVNVTRRGLVIPDPDKSGHFIARLLWDIATYEIDLLWVAEDFRRRGIATALYRLAQQQENGRIRHSGWRTLDGEAWAQSLDEELPKWLPC